jgi:transcription elongation factor GreA
MESRILEITQILNNATVVDAPKRSNKVALGSTVLVRDANGKEREFTIVGAAEADARSGRISNESPVGAALIGAKKEDTVTVETPSGKEIDYKILKISK